MEKETLGPTWIDLEEGKKDSSKGSRCLEEMLMVTRRDQE